MVDFEEELNKVTSSGELMSPMMSPKKRPPCKRLKPDHHQQHLRPAATAFNAASAGAALGAAAAFISYGYGLWQ